LTDAIAAHPREILNALRQAQETEKTMAFGEKLDEQLAIVKQQMVENPITGLNIDGRVSMYGDSASAITVVEYVDFFCPFCANAHEMLGRLSTQYGTKFRVIVKHLPLLDNHSRMAAEVFEALAMDDQQKAIVFYERLLNEQHLLKANGDKFINLVLQEMGVDMKKVNTNRKSPELKNKIENDIKETKKLKIVGTPGFVVNGALVNGNYPEVFFKKLFDSILAAK
jgi:protein-disulfide isomerase